MSLLEHSILQLSGRDGTAEFNVNPKEDTFELSMGKEKKRFKIIDLYAITFAICGTEQQANLMPIRRSEVLTYRRIHRIRLKKAMPEGGIVTCRCEINVEQTVAEGLKGMIEQQKNDLKTGVPIIGLPK